MPPNLHFTYYMKIKIEQVKAVLGNMVDARDNDNLLIAVIWEKQIAQRGFQIAAMTAWNLLKMVVDGHLSSTESITRARRKCQELYPELRGANYNKRQANQSDVKKQLGYGN